MTRKQTLILVSLTIVATIPCIIFEHDATATMFVLLLTIPFIFDRE